MVKARKRKNCRGAATVEAAIVLFVLFLLTFGIIEYGWLFLKLHQITNAARSGVRVAVRYGSMEKEVTDTISNLMTAAKMAGKYDVIYTPAAQTGDPVTVDVNVPCESVAIMKVPFLPLPPHLSASVTMAKEGP